MKKYIASIVTGVLLFSPAFAAADTQSELTSIYAQLISLLRRQVELLQESKRPTLSILSTTGTAPFTAIFTAHDRTGTESIDFGDGVSTGIQGCVKNVFGWCDLSSSVSHVYRTPATYTVFFYSHIKGGVQTLSTNTITVTR